MIADLANAWPDIAVLVFAVVLVLSIGYFWFRFWNEIDDWIERL